MKNLQRLLKQSKQLQKARKSSLEYDGSQEAINRWLKANPVGAKVNGGRELKYKLKLKEFKQAHDPHDFKLLQNARRQIISNQISVGNGLDIQVSQAYDQEPSPKLPPHEKRPITASISISRTAS